MTRDKQNTLPMARATNNDASSYHPPSTSNSHCQQKPQLSELSISCTMNTAIGMTLAALRQPPDPSIDPSFPGATETDSHDSHLIRSLQSLRSLIFRPQRGSWHSIDPTAYFSPFLNIIQSEDVTAIATSVSLYALLKILRLNIINERTCGAREAIQALVMAITNCHLEFTDLALEESVLMRILEVLTALVHSDASFFLTDHAVCTIVISCFQIVQQSNDCNDLFQRSARHSMHELIEVIFSRLPHMKSSDGDPADSGSEAEKNAPLASFTAQCMIDTFHFLCSLLNAEEIVDAEVDTVSSDEEVQLFALLLINSVVELGGDNIKDHPGILRIIQDDLFRRLIHHGARSGHPILSMICNIVFSLYHFLRRYLRLQLEAFFIFVLLKNAEGTYGSQLQEVAVEGVVSFCKLPNFVMEMYVNYDCDPIRHNVLEEIVKLLCKTAYPMSSPISSMQIQAFQGLVTIIHSIADGIKVHQALSPEAYVIDDSEFKPFWLERCDVYTDPDSWVEFVRMRKFKKKKILIAADHYNRNEKKGMEFLNFHRLVPSPPDAKSIAHFFRYAPRLDKNKIGDYLGDPNGFNITVLKEFTHTFEFDGLILDTALRTFLETFRLPGESQKIQRILEAFSERFYDQQTSNIFVNKDAVFILCYSLIMLNTDLHNSQVKKKMTEDEFIKNNRAINGGIDLPREHLSGLFHSISANAISLNNSFNAVISEMNSNLWADLLKQSRVSEPFILCDYKHKLCREVFISISGLSVATLSIIFEQTDDQDVLQECIEGLFSIARISRYSLDDILDELLCSFCKFTSLLNPYATAEEIVFNFSNEVKPRMATLAIFKIAKKFGSSIRGAWRNLVDCLLKLKRLKLLPPILTETDNNSETEASEGHHSKSESRSSVIFPSSNPGSGKHNIPGMVGRFTQLSLETCADLMLNAANEMENNLKIIQQCQIDNLFLDSSQLSHQSLQHLLRALVFAAAGKGQKFSTPVEEEETVGFCWDLIVVIIKVNLHRFSTIWMQFHESLSQVSQFPLFSPCPFAEKAMVALLQLATQMLLKLPTLSDRQPEEMIFKSINLTWKLDKDIVESCNESVTEATVKILSNYASSVQTPLGWKTLLHLLSVTGRHPKNFDRSVETLIGLMINGEHITKNNYAYFIEAAFGFAALKISPLEKSSQLLDLMAGSVKWIIQWQKSSFHEPGISNLYNVNSSSIEKGISKMSSIHLNNLAAMNLFMKLAEALRKTSLVRREEIRNQAVDALGWCFLDVADELEWTAGSYASSFNLVIFAMVDDLHEKMVEYSRREGMEREMRSMEGTLKMALEQMVEVYLCFMVRLAAGPGFRTFWLGLLRRMDTCMKAGLGEEGHPSMVMEELVPELLKRMILEMKEKHVLEKSDESDLWEVTNIQIQWIAPSIKEELFPEN